MANVVEGKKWLQERLAFLRQELDRSDDDAARAAIEEEIRRISEELDRSKRGWRRWFLLGGRLPGQ